VARLPFSDDAFDIVLSSECIEHTVVPVESFTSLARVLKPGGTLVLSVPNRRWHLSLRLARAAGIRPYDGLENWVHPDELRRWAVAAGLHVLQHFGVHPLPFQLPLARKWLPPLERILEPFGMWMINQVIVARKPE
jgi:2-polyprenyl-3-methyl-5-hydroxy-6-metoxy-1,4-benzoquinol methylase